MTNHIYNEETDKTLCGDYSGELARSISTGNYSCPECLDAQSEFCRHCGNKVEVMCQKGTGFCCQLCQEIYDA